MKAIILDPQVKVYSTMDTNSLSIATLQEGNEVEFRGTKRNAGKQWVPITLPTGQQAFIPGEARVFVVREGQIKQDNVDMHTEPSANSLIKQQLMRNTKLSILRVVKSADQDWVKVRDDSGNEGYIKGETRIRLVVQRTKALGRKNIINGVMWLIAGLVWVFSERSMTANSGLWLLGYAALVFGLFMLISGIVQYVKAPA